MNKILFISFGTLAFLMSACYYDKEEKLYPPEVCTIVDSTFSKNVLPILESHCYTCHSSATYAGISGVCLEGYTNVKVQVDNGQLLKAINHLPGAEPMPRNSSKLSDCDIQKFTNWIDGGSLNN